MFECNVPTVIRVGGGVGGGVGVRTSATEIGIIKPHINIYRNTT